MCGILIGIYYPEKNRFRVPVILMERMQLSLTNLVENSKNLSFNKITTILNDVCLGLQYLHSRTPPIIHRDLTPNNILLCYHHRAKISDLGVARTLQSSDTNKLTHVPGTPHFMPPECLDNRSVYNLSLDIFSIGGVILYVATRQWPEPAPWMSFDPNTNEKICLTSEVQRRQQYLDKMTGASGGLKHLAISCLDDNPNNRPSVAMVLAEIKQVKRSFDEKSYCDLWIGGEQQKEEQLSYWKQLEKNRQQDYQKQEQPQQQNVQQHELKLETWQHQQLMKEHHQQPLQVICS